jgi:hypothetical protein
MSFTITNVPVFTKIVSFLKDSLDTIILNFKETGITTKTLNNTKTILIETSFPVSSLEDYTITCNSATIDLTNYVNVLKCISKADRIQHTITNEKFNIQAKVGKRNTNVSLGMLDIDQDDMEPTTDYDLVVEMESKTLYQNVKDLCTFIGSNDESNPIYLKVTQKTIEFSTSTELTDNIQFVIDCENDLDTGEEMLFPVSGIVFLQMVKAYIFADRVNLFFAHDMPLTLHYTCNDNVSWVRMFIAPMTV